MLFSTSLQSSLFAACWLLRLTSAQQDDAQQPLVTPQPKNPNENMMPIIGQLVSDCEPTVSMCGSIEDTKVEQEWVNVVIAYINTTVEAVKTMPTSTETRTSWEFETITTSSAGRCRNTTTVKIDIPTTVTLNRTITTTVEFVPVTHTWVKSISTVKVAALDQCFIRNPPIPFPTVPVVPPVGGGSPLPQAAAVMGDMKDGVVVDEPKPAQGVAGAAAAAAAAAAKKAAPKK